MNTSDYIVKSPKLGALPHNRDYTDIIQHAIDTAHKADSRIVQPPPARMIVNGLIIRSRVVLDGHGESSTIIQLADDANCNIIETEAFDNCCTSGLRWFIEEGMVHGFGFRNLRIDGNRDNNTHGHGLAIYGKRYIIDNILIVNYAV